MLEARIDSLLKRDSHLFSPTCQGFRCLVDQSDVWFKHAPLLMLDMVRSMVAHAHRDPCDRFYLQTTSVARVALKELLVDSSGFSDWLALQSS